MFRASRKSNADTGGGETRPLDYVAIGRGDILVFDDVWGCRHEWYEQSRVPGFLRGKICAKCGLFKPARKRR